MATIYDHTLGPLYSRITATSIRNLRFQLALRSESYADGPATSSSCRQRSRRSSPSLLRKPRLGSSLALPCLHPGALNMREGTRCFISSLDK